MIEPKKRKGPGSNEMALVPALKKPRSEMAAAPGQQQLMPMGPPRSSSLQAPIMLLCGHEGEVHCCKFHPNGATLASAGFDRLILMWNVYGDCDNFATLKGHSGAVMELHYNTDGRLVAELEAKASTDKTVGVWDSETGERMKRLKGHTSFVNSCYPARRGPQVVCTGSDDGTVKLWDIRKKAAVHTFQNTYQVLSVTFNDTSDQIISGGIDNDIKVMMWNVYGDCDNFATLKGHSGAVMELHYNTDGRLVAELEAKASTDKTVGVWDSETGERMKRLKGHTSFVNSCYPARRGPQVVCTGSDDGTVKLWDIRKKAAVHTFQNTYQVLSVTFNDTSDQIISGGIDNDIKVWDLRQNKLIYTMRGHADSLTGLSLSSEGSYLLSNSMDNTVRIWDVRPFAPKERCLKIFQGSIHNFEKNLLRCSWSPDGSKIAAGSADRFVYVWDTTSRRILYKLPGHAGSVNEVAFHPEEPIVLSGSSDKRLYMGEIQ
ncbi:UNVERIFIED_CONTAM: hypothetical protein FKN15_028225 [Acipenser sinensis]